MCARVVRRWTRGALCQALVAWRCSSDELSKARQTQARILQRWTCRVLAAGLDAWQEYVEDQVSRDRGVARQVVEAPASVLGGWA